MCKTLQIQGALKMKPPKGKGIDIWASGNLDLSSNLPLTRLEPVAFPLLTFFVVDALITLLFKVSWIQSVRMCSRDRMLQESEKRPRVNLLSIHLLGRRKHDTRLFYILYILVVLSGAGLGWASILFFLINFWFRRKKVMPKITRIKFAFTNIPSAFIWQEKTVWCLYEAVFCLLRGIIYSLVHLNIASCFKK